MNIALSFRRFTMIWTVALCLGGCSILNPPAGITPRKFVLSPVHTAAESPARESANLVVGIKQVKVPGYLSTKAFAVRRSDNEIVYPESLQWAERLDSALQQVLGANLSALIPTDQVRFTLWDPGTVSVQIDVSVAQFDVNSQGEAVLVAWWRLLSPTNTVISSGQFSQTRQGPSPDANPQNAVSSLSSLVGELAEKLAQEIKQSRTPPPA